MMGATQKRGAVVITSLFALGCWLSIYFQQIAGLGIIVMAVAAFFLCSHPMLLFLLLAVTIPWSIEYSVTSSLSTDLPDEPLMLLLSFVVLLLIVQNRKIKELPLATSVLFAVLLLQVLWWVISAGCSTDGLISFKFLLAKGWYLLAFVGAPLLLLQKPGDFTRLGIVLLASMFLFVVVAIVRHALNGFTFEAINPSLEPFFRNHVNYSALLVVTIPILFAFRVAASAPKTKSLLTVCLFIMLAALYLSYARGAWLALVVGVGAYWLLKRRLLVLAYITFLVLTLAAVWWLKTDNRYMRYAPDYRTTIFHTDFREHMVATYQFKDVSTAERFYRWVAGVRMVKDNWLTGYGPNTFYYHYKRYAAPAFKTWVSKNEERSTVHNYFLLTLIEQGVMGLLLLLFLLGYMFYTAQRAFHLIEDTFWRRLMATVAVMLAMICTVNFLSDLIETDKVGSIFYVCLAILILAELKMKKDSEFPAHV